MLHDSVFSLMLSVCTIHDTASCRIHHGLQEGSKPSLLISLAFALPVIRMSMRNLVIAALSLSLRLPSRHPFGHFTATGLAAYVYGGYHLCPIERNGEASELGEGRML